MRLDLFGSSRVTESIAVSRRWFYVNGDSGSAKMSARVDRDSSSGVNLVYTYVHTYSVK